MASRRQELTNEVIQRKENLWGRNEGRHGYSNIRSVRNIVKQQPSLALLQWAANATDAELMAAARSRDPDYEFLYYH
jgi:hypothetical protein